MEHLKVDIAGLGALGLMNQALQHFRRSFQRAGRIHLGDNAILSRPLHVCSGKSRGIGMRPR